MARAKRFFDTLQTAWTVVGITLALTTGCSYLAGMIARAIAQDEIDVRSRADAYTPDEAWVDDYFVELKESFDTRWHSYVYFRRAPRKGRYIEIDERGVRKTANPDSLPADAPKIFMFGGSTMHGAGARNEHTIPSLVSQALAARGCPAEVTNFGESGYVSTQELIALLSELQHGARPDLVVFYDGVNDVLATFQSGVAGIPHNEHNRRTEFNLTHPAHTERLYGHATTRLLHRLGFTQLWWGLSERNATPRPAAIPAGLDFDDAAVGIAASYGTNVRTIRAIAEAYGFDALLYWQPTVFTKKKKSRTEEASALQWAAIAPLYEKANNEVRSKLVVHDISTILDDQEAPLYIDFHHVTKAANEIIAARMLEDITAALETRGSATPHQ